MLSDPGKGVESLPEVQLFGVADPGWEADGVGKHDGTGTDGSG